MSLEAASERMKIEMMSEEGDDDERKAKDKGVGEDREVLKEILIKREGI